MNCLSCETHSNPECVPYALLKCTATLRYIENNKNGGEAMQISLVTTHHVTIPACV